MTEDRGSQGARAPEGGRPPRGPVRGALAVEDDPARRLPAARSTTPGPSASGHALLGGLGRASTACSRSALSDPYRRGRTSPISTGQNSSCGRIFGLLLAVVLAMAGARHRAAAIARSLVCGPDPPARSIPTAQAFVPIAAARVDRARPSGQACVDPGVAVVVLAGDSRSSSSPSPSRPSSPCWRDDRAPPPRGRGARPRRSRLLRGPRAPVDRPRAVARGRPRLRAALDPDLEGIRRGDVAPRLRPSRYLSRSFSSPPRHSAAWIHARDRARAVETGGGSPSSSSSGRRGSSARSTTLRCSSCSSPLPLLLDVAAGSGASPSASHSRHDFRAPCSPRAALCRRNEPEAALRGGARPFRGSPGTRTRSRVNAFREHAARAPSEGRGHADLRERAKSSGGARSTWSRTSSSSSSGTVSLDAEARVPELRDVLAPELADLNARFLEGPKAPTSSSSISARSTRASDDGRRERAARARARDYKPVLARVDRLLLRRNARARPASRGRSCAQAQSGSGGRSISRACLGPATSCASTSGRRSRAASRDAIEERARIRVEIVLDDEDRLGFRIVPSMMRAGVLVDPAIWTHAGWVDWCTGQRMRRPVRLTVVAPERAWGTGRRSASRSSARTTWSPSAARPRRRPRLLDLRDASLGSARTSSPASACSSDTR